MNKVTVLMDMDGVLYPFEEACSELYVQYGGEPLVFDKWVDFSTMPGDLMTKVWEDPTLFKRSDPYPGAIEMMVALQQMEELDVYIVTRPGRNPNITIPAKIEWVTKWMPWFDLHNFTTMFPKWLFSSNVIVDDHPPVVDKWRKYNLMGLPVLFSRPWNADKVEWMQRRGAFIAKDYIDVLDVIGGEIEEHIERGA